MNRARFEAARGSLRCRDAERARMSPNGTLLSLGRETVKARALLLWLVARSNLIDLGSLLKGEPAEASGCVLCRDSAQVALDRCTVCVALIITA